MATEKKATTAKKATTKKPAAKKPATKATTTKSPAKKPAARKATTAKTTTTRKTAAKKTTAKTTAAKKPTTRKTTPRKTATKKPAPRKSPVIKPEFNPDVVGESAKENMADAAKEIDKQMKEIAKFDTSILIAMDNFSEFQEKAHEKWNEFEKKGTETAKTAWEKAKQALADHDIKVEDIKKKREEAMQSLKENKALHDTYESIVDALDKGRKKAAEEAKKAEVAFMKQLHKIEEQMLKKADQIKKKYRDDD